MQTKLAQSIFKGSQRQSVQPSKYVALLNVLLRVADPIFTWGTAWLCWWLRFGTTAIPHQYALGIAIVSLLTLIVFQVSGIYRSWRGEGLRDEIIRVWVAWCLVFAIFLTLQWMFKATAEYSRIWEGSWFLMTAIIFAGARWSARTVLGAIRRQGIDSRSVVIVGATASGSRIARILGEDSWCGLKIVGYVSTSFDQEAYNNLPCLGAVEKYLESEKNALPDEIWLALPLRAGALIQNCLESLQDAPITLRLIPDFLDYRLLNNHATELAGVPVLTLRGSPLEGYAHLIKATEDRLLSALILLLTLPLMLLIAIGVKLSGPGPALYRQKRLGWNGRTFDMLKFRSMPVDTENENVRWGDAKNKKTTWFGAFLRRTSLDELPQFINVLAGEMSIVGPRPERPEFVEQFKGQIEGYMQKHLVKAGITGWAQVNGWRGDTDLKTRIEHDLFYIENWSLVFDLKIILMTVLRVFIDKNAY